MLLSAGLPVPTRILVHGYVTVEGRKIGKSAGNAIDPIALTKGFGIDALRYYLLRHIRSTGDGDFLRERLRQAYESELAGQFGNLAHRVLSMIERYCDGIVPAPPEGPCEDDHLLRAAAGLPETVAEHLRAFAFDRALDAIWAFIAQANRYVSEEEPWALAKQAAASPGAEEGGVFTARLRGCLFSLAVALDTIARAIAPLLPGSSLRLARKLGRSGGYDRPEPASSLIGSRVGAGVPLFPMAIHAADTSGMSV
jgi:methionyl-tRNA synthetase